MTIYGNYRHFNLHNYNPLIYMATSENNVLARCLSQYNLMISRVTNEKTSLALFFFIVAIIDRCFYCRCNVGHVSAPVLKTGAIATVYFRGPVYVCIYFQFSKLIIKNTRIPCSHAYNIYNASHHQIAGA